MRPAPLPDALDVVADPHAREPQAALEAGELYAAVAALPEEFRDVLVAVDITGLSYKETARALRIREGTVMSRLYRARQQVVRRLEAALTRQSPVSTVPASTRSPDEAWSPSACSRVTVSVGKSFGDTPAQSVTSSPSLKVPTGTSTPSAFRSHAW